MLHMFLVRIPGKQTADFESRRNQRECEWSLDKASLICALERQDFKPDIDLCAYHIKQ